MIINEGSVSSKSTFFKKRLDRVKNQVENAFVTQSEVEDEVLRLNKILHAQVMKFKYNLNPYPHAFSELRKEICMLEKIAVFLPIDTYSFDKWEDEEKEVAICVYPHISKIIKDLQWIDSERKKIREVAKTAPAGEKYAYDKCRGQFSNGLDYSTDTFIRKLENVRKELSKHKDVLR